ncbi:MAG TPA: hypothetical protein VJS43_18290 [Candidatus Acidoferrales bacterium]|nr:hypothetical protein [Candidatus Acidoferrales bacterium]
MKPNEPNRRKNANPALAALAAIGSVLAASSCCLSTLPFLAAGGIAAGASFLAGMKPYLLGAAIALLGYGFYQAKRARACGRKISPVSVILLGTSTAFVIFSIAFPQLMANLAADILAR